MGLLAIQVKLTGQSLYKMAQSQHGCSFDVHDFLGIFFSFLIVISYCTGAITHSCLDRKSVV